MGGWAVRFGQSREHRDHSTTETWECWMFASQINVGQTSVQICLDIILASVSGIGMMSNSSPYHSHKCPGLDNELCASLDACNSGGYLCLIAIIINYREESFLTQMPQMVCRWATRYSFRCLIGVETESHFYNFKMYQSWHSIWECSFYILWLLSLRPMQIPSIFPPVSPGIL